MMERIYNGMSGSRLQAARWLKSRYSNPDGSCVEVAMLGGDAIAVRNSRDPEGPVLVYTSAEIEAFLLGAKDGEFDCLLG